MKCNPRIYERYFIYIISLIFLTAKHYMNKVLHACLQVLLKSLIIIAKHTMVSDIGKATQIKITKILPLLQFEKPTKDSFHK